MRYPLDIRACLEHSPNPRPQSPIQAEDPVLGIPQNCTEQHTSLEQPESPIGPRFEFQPEQSYMVFARASMAVVAVVMVVVHVVAVEVVQ